MDSSRFWDEIVKYEDSDSIKFTVFDVKKLAPISAYTISDNAKRLKSNGTVQTILELHVLMSKSLSLISPKLLFTPDFPDYLLAKDDPRYINELPTISSTANSSMPHHRTDLWDRTYNKYDELIEVPTPHITWGVVRTEPGTVSAGRPFTGKQEFKPRLREYVAVFHNGNVKGLGSYNLKLAGKDGELETFVEIYGQSFDNLVQYNIWARSAWEVEELTDWFIDYMTKYTGLFREAGISQMFFWDRVRDDTIMQIKNGYHVRSLLYYIRTEKINIHTINPIEKVTLTTNSVTPSGKVNTLTDINAIDDNYYDLLLDKWSNN